MDPFPGNASTPMVYECGGLLFRVAPDPDPPQVECLIGTEWRPSHLTYQALLALDPRAVAHEELARLHLPP